MRSTPTEVTGSEKRIHTQSFCPVRAMTSESRRPRPAVEYGARRVFVVTQYVLTAGKLRFSVGRVSVGVLGDLDLLHERREVLESHGGSGRSTFVLTRSEATTWIV
jgi:hypothetical protein